ncbi:hypothetical protein BKH40_03620 [Helicobacter sp. 11S02629-2]|nr:hypothetical protein BKH40_03620 [Helicobacter sp. 11S02629-2]
MIIELSNAYLAKGYSTTLITIKSIDEKNAILVLEVKYGYVDKVILNGVRNDLETVLGVPLRKGKVLNLYDLDQSIENLSTAFPDITSNIVASTKEGYSDIIFTGKPKYFNAAIDFNNNALKNHGQNRLGLSYTQNNFLHINDRFSAYYIYRLVSDRDRYKEDTFFINYGFPISRWSFYYSFQYSGTSATLSGNAGSFINKNVVSRHSLVIKRVMFRNQFSKLSLYTTLNLRDSLNTIANVRLNESSGIYTALNLGVEFSTRLFDGNFYGSLEYQKGLPLPGAKKNDGSIYDINYQKVYLNAAYQKYLYASKEAGILYRGNLVGSYSKNPLLFTDKFFVGDEYSVRGFKESSLALDYGIYLNNTISFKPLGLPWYLAGLEPFIGFDMAYGRDYELSHSDFIIGGSAGIYYNIKYFSLSFTYSLPLRRSFDMPSESNPIYLRVSLSV